MINKAVNDIKLITSAVALRTDWIQGAGGNTSVKLDNGQMLVKASGKQLETIISEHAFVAVNVAEIKNTLRNETILIADKERQEYVENCIVNATVKPTLWKASMETGFHCLYDKYVIHTHNVYANVFLCSSGYEELLALFTGHESYTVAMLKHYYTPGVVLSWHLYNEFRFNDAMPNVTFLPNHGVIYSANDSTQLLALYNDVEQKLVKAIQPKAYPDYSIETTIDGIIVLCDFLFYNFCGTNNDLIFTELLFPDQAVYIQQNDFSNVDENAKFYINVAAKQMFTRANISETKAVVELLIAYYYLRIEINANKWKPLTINYDWHNLANMKSEQYRKSLL